MKSSQSKALFITFKIPDDQCEWYHYHEICKTQIFDDHDIEYDPHHPSIYQKNVQNYIIYNERRDIIGSVKLENRTVTKTILRIIALKKDYQLQGYGKTILKELDRLLAFQGIEEIFLNSKPTLVTFYSRQGYFRQDFDDDSCFPGCIKMGKSISIT